MLNELLRLSALALIAILLAFAGMVSSKSMVSNSCISEYAEDKADQIVCEDAVLTAMATVDSLHTQ